MGEQIRRSYISEMVSRHRSKIGTKHSRLVRARRRRSYENTLANSTLT